MMTKMHMPPPHQTQDRRSPGLWVRLLAVLSLGAAAYGLACAASGIDMARPIHEIARQFQG